jgi:hypothetical protein
MDILKIDRIIRYYWSEHVKNVDEDVYRSLLKGEGVNSYKKNEKPFSDSYTNSLEIIVQAVTITRMLIELRNYFKLKPSTKSKYEELESSLNYRLANQSLNKRFTKNSDIINSILNDENPA